MWRFVFGRDEGDERKTWAVRRALQKRREEDAVRVVDDTNGQFMLSGIITTCQTLIHALRHAVASRYLYETPTLPNHISTLHVQL